MRKNILSAVLLALFVGVLTVSAAPTCASLVTASGINVLSINGLGGCTVGNLLFSNFQVSNASAGTGTAEIDLTQNGVSIAGSTIGLNFNPNLGFATTGGTITDLHFSFTVTGGLIGAGLDNTNSINSSINELACTGSSSTSGCTAPILWNTVDASGQASQCIGSTASGNGFTGVCSWGGGQPTVNFFKDISIGDPSTSHNTSFTETFITPEPVTLSLMGFGLLGLGLMSRRLRK